MENLRGFKLLQREARLALPFHRSHSLWKGARMSDVVFENRSGIALLRLSNPPVNALGLELRRSIVKNLDRANGDPEIKAIILMGSERAFSGGADIGEFGTESAMAHPDLPTVIDVLDASAKPVIAAISGACMGGGLELALGCHFRVASLSAQIALPEVKLGLLPGAGGTQRLPRLLGIERALNLMVSGAAQPAREFAEMALFDALIEGDLLEAALRFAQTVIGEKRPLPRVRDIKVRDSGSEAYLQFARNMLKSPADEMSAQGACVDAVAASLLGFDEGMARERRLFETLLHSRASIAARHLFLAERAAGRMSDLPPQTRTRPIGSVGVIGAGIMGGGITMNFLNAGIPVVLVEATQQALDKGIATIRRNYATSIKKGKLTEQQLEQRMGLITPVLDYASLADVDLVIEAVFESMEVKASVFRRLDAVCKPGAILASNTSYLDINRIAGFTQRPEDVLGLHFFSPANVMRLLEIVRGARTAPDVLATVVQLSRRIQKTCVVAGVCDGFIGNRMLEPYLAAAEELVVAGATTEEVDTALQHFGMAMGPFRMMDLAGLDIGWATRKRKALEYPDKDFSSVLHLLCEAGRFGQKTGAGWYRYEAGKRDPIADPATAQYIEEFREKKGVHPRSISADEIVQRCLFSLINEGARILEEGIAQRASDLDVVYIHGYGFPARCGGPMCYADQVGLPNVVRRLQHFATAAEGDDGSAWSPAPLLARLAAAGKTFN
jgi:3-hydroxyacyl-CoA dehydrogenase